MKTCPVCDTPYPSQHNTCPTDGSVLIETQELPPGQLIRGKYRIVRKLGQGGMGVVYLAEHLLLGGQMALKFLAVELSRNPQFVKRFRNEARAAYHLRHPNIVEVSDLDQDEDGTLFIAMEFVSGPSLRSVLRKSKTLFPVARSLQVAGGVAAGLAAAHARGAIHRDIKPENILLLVGPTGEVQPKLLDFGIATMADSVTGISQTRGLLLTPEYAAPEQWRGTPSAELDGRTDLYALGCVLYEMLAGRPPFHAANPEGWMFQHLQGVPEPLGQLRPDLANDYPNLEAIVMRLLARERDQRFASASEFLEALKSVSQISVTAMQPLEAQFNAGLQPTAQIGVLENRSETPAAKSQVTSNPQLGDARLPLPADKESPARNRRLRVWSIGVLLVACIAFAVLWMASRHQSGPPLQGGTGQTQAVAPPATHEQQKSPVNDQAEHSAGNSSGASGTPARSTEVAPPEAAQKHSESTGVPRVSLPANEAQEMLIESTQPVYPAIARAARVSGTVSLKCVISTAGTIRELKVVSGPLMLRQAAIDSVKAWRYRPYILNGKPAEVDTTVTIQFTVKN
jgi:serine/threonine-protein kinase